MASSSALGFFDLQTHTAYTLRDNNLSLHTKKPKSVDILCPPLAYFTHLLLEVAQESLHNPNLSSLLFALAYQKSALNEPPYSYELYFTQRPHLFDEQKSICECFFYHKIQCMQDFAPLPKAHIVTSDIFLPCALSVFGVHSPFVVWIESFLCYFDNGILKEALPCALQEQEAQNKTESSSNPLLTLINTHIAYLQEAYNQHFTQLYYFGEKKCVSAFILAFQTALNEENLTPSESKNANFVADSMITESLQIHLSHTIHNQTLHIAPLSHLCESTYHLDFQSLKATLALHYATLVESKVLPNFASKPLLHKKLFYTLVVLFVMFICIIPLSFVLYNYSLQRAIVEINAQSDNLFTSTDLESQNPSSSSYSTIQGLMREKEYFISHLQDFSLWQQSYNERYIFMQSIFKEHTAHINYEEISFYFTPRIFVASLEVSAESKIHISQFLALFNTHNQRAFMLKPMQEKPDRESLRFYASIIVVHYAI